MADKKMVLQRTDENGQLKPIGPQSFRNFVSADPEAAFPAEPGRYLLYFNYGCPWAHRTLMVRGLKGLEHVIELVEVDGRVEGEGWVFSGKTGPEQDTLYGFTSLRQLYRKADSSYAGRITVPVLWDKKKETIVNNESSDIIRIFNDAFDSFIPEERRENVRGEASLFPAHLRDELETMDEWVYDTVSMGVYKTGFATTQKAYEDHVFPLFESLDKLEEHLGDPHHQPYLFGENVSVADVRLFSTLIRFDVAYYPIFKCNLKMIRHDYPRLHRWLRNLYWDESEKTRGIFNKSVRFDAYKAGYSMAVGAKIVPVGPIPNILPL